MNRLLPAALLSCAAASLSNSAWSFQGFDFFQQIEHSIECVRKPGTDILVCSNKFVPADNEEEEEITPEPEVEPTPPPEVSNPNAFAKITFDEVLAVEAEYDDIWSKADSYDTDVDLRDLTHHTCQIEDYDSAEFDHNEVDQLFDIRKIDLNSDSYPDYILSITCRSLNPAVGADPRYFRLDVFEPFLVMMCGDQSGLYNCTKEITGHDTAFNQSLPGGWPGMTALNQLVLHDINGDGVRDMILPQSNDVSGHSGFEDPNYASGTPAVEAGYNHYGYTKSEMIELCETIWPNSVNEDNCWLNRANQTYAISGPDGVWELKQFQAPIDMWNGNGSTDLYFIDGEYHVNWDTHDSGMIRWFKFNSRTEEFEYVTMSHNETPIDTQDQSVIDQYIVNPDSTQSKYEWFAQTGDFDTRTYYIDPDKSKLGFNGCSFENPDYDRCQIDQLHVWKRDQAGNVSKFFEYRPADWADEILPVQPYEMVNGEISKGVRNWDNQQTFGMYLHGHWVNNNRLYEHITGSMQQLEDRPDAPWYFIVSYFSYSDIRYPGEEYQEEFVWRGMHHKPDDRSDHRFYFEGTEIVFKYKVDMDTGELTYAGTLFEHPWVYHGFDGWGPDSWTWTDVNGDGYLDPQFITGPFGFAFLSNSQGELQYVDRELSSPLYEYGENSDIGRVLNYNTDLTFGEDLDSDGVSDLFMIVNGEDLHQKVDIHVADPAIKELYERDHTYIDIIYGARDWITNSPILDSTDIRDRIDGCVDDHNTRNFTIGQSPYVCYRKEIW